MRRVELLIIGAGPAGLGAAIEASKVGVDVLLVDDKNEPGGQLFKQIHKFFGSKAHKAGTRGIELGTNLLSEAKNLGVTIELKTRILGFMENDIISIQKNGQSAEPIKADSVIIATGAEEKSLSFPGWTLPGVMTAGAAQTMINIDRVKPGNRVLMIGSGNVGLIVSYQLLQAGINVVGVVEALSEVSGYSVHANKVKRAGVPIYTSHTIKKAIGDKKVQKAEIVEVDENWREKPASSKIFEIDTLCLAVGLKPGIKLVNTAGCKLEYFGELGGFLPIHDDNMETSRKGFFVAGDVAGVEEANTALDEGRLAGIAAAKYLEKITEQKFEKHKKIIWERLNDLRKGPFGNKRDKIKQKIIQSAKSNQTKKENYTFNNNLDNNEKNKINLCKSTEEVKKLPGYPSEDSIKDKKVVCIECGQKIPCDPCVEACPFNVISIEPEITELPEIDESKCKGCGLCIAQCPGQAIFMIDYNYSSNKAALSLPYEYYPLPHKGEIVKGLNRQGNLVEKVKVLKVDKKERYDKTAVITVEVGKENIHNIRSIERDS